MTHLKKILLISLAIITVTPILSWAKENQITFKDVMQDLLTDTQQITKGIILEDFQLIEQAANKIANHPKPDLAIRMKVVKTLGNEMGKFKAKDTVVHNSAVNILSAAKANDMNTITKEYQQLVNGCLACHAGFKEKVAKALK